jgi:8-oxo-dGTP pyrophosphatase MutT (NUDIX family)
VPVPRVVALALVRRPGTRQILVFEGADPARGLRYRRPHGGGVEFGERSADALVRELREELGVTVTPVRVVGTFEEMFTIDGVPKHEVLIVHEVTLDPPSLYDLDVLPDVESGVEPGIWHDLDDPPPGILLFPEGLADLL